MPTLVIKNPDGSQQEQEFGSELTIGRAEGNELILSEGGVSRRHARFFMQGADVMVEDVGSANGTWVDGEQISGPVKVTAKSQVAIGDYEVQLKLGSKPIPRTSTAGAKPSRTPTTPGGKVVRPSPKPTRAVPASRPAPGSAGLAKRPAPGRAAGPQLRGLTGALTGKTFPVAGTLSVGRVAGVDIQIDDDSVSRRHAELELRGGEVVLRDLGSANGTAVNGAPLEAEATLAPGDIVQFGVVELMFESNVGGAGAPARPVPARRPESGPRPARPRREEAPARSPEPEEAPGMDPRRKRLLLAAGGVAALLFVLVLVKAVTAAPDPVDKRARPLAGDRRPAATVEPEDPAEQIELLLSECRTYASLENEKTDWARADAACQKVLELEPIHQEANTLVKRISVLKVCEANLNRGKELFAAGRMEQALDELAKVGKDCEGYLLRALAAAKEPLAEVKREAGDDCKTYAKADKWDNALKRCELYARLACQTMESKDLYAPALMRLKLEGSVNPKTEWRPSDPLYVFFLRARVKAGQGDTVWSCPEIPAFRPPPPPPDPARAAKEELARRYKDADMGKGMTYYFEGRPNEASVQLKKVLEVVGKAALHDAARALELDVTTAFNFFKLGSTEITNDKPERAEEPFRKALEIDERIVLGDAAAKLSPEEKKRELERRTSFIRRNVIELMSSKCYEKGKGLADRKDFRQACRLWKLGADFSRANIDLLKALTNVCTRRASESFERAEGCEQFKAALDFAVDGDGFKEKIAAAMAEGGCN